MRIGSEAITEQAASSPWANWWAYLLGPAGGAYAAAENFDTQAANFYVATTQIPKPSSSVPRAAAPSTTVLEQMKGATNAQAAALWNPVQAAQIGYSDWLTKLQSDMNQWDSQRTIALVVVAAVAGLIGFAVVKEVVR
jgi:hypothetical protein